MAGLVALLNDLRLNQQQPTMGWMNQWMYSAATSFPAIFNDIVAGDNLDGDLQERNSPFPEFCQYGFYTQPGWDAVTGLGSPNWGEMAKIVNTFGFTKENSS